MLDIQTPAPSQSHQLAMPSLTIPDTPCPAFHSDSKSSLLHLFFAPGYRTGHLFFPAKISACALRLFFPSRERKRPSQVFLSLLHTALVLASQPLPKVPCTYMFSRNSCLAGSNPQQSRQQRSTALCYLLQPIDKPSMS